MEFQLESLFNLEFQPKFGIQLGIPIPIGINLGECITWGQFVHIQLGGASQHAQLLDNTRDAIFLLYHNFNWHSSCKEAKEASLRLPGTYAAKIDKIRPPCMFPLIILLLDHIEGNVQGGSDFHLL